MKENDKVNPGQAKQSNCRGRIAAPCGPAMTRGECARNGAHVPVNKRCKGENHD